MSYFKIQPLQYAGAIMQIINWVFLRVHVSVYSKAQRLCPLLEKRSSSSYFYTAMTANAILTNVTVTDSSSAIRILWVTYNEPFCFFFKRRRCQMKISRQNISMRVKIYKPNQIHSLIVWTKKKTNRIIPSNKIT